MSTKFKAEMNGAWVTNATIGFGMQLYILFAPNCAAPLGFVWGIRMAAGKIAKKTRFETVGSYVPPFARRMGVRSRINEEIFKHNDVITTQDGSVDGGEAFLRANGYVLDRYSGVWAKSKPKAKRSKAA